MVASASHANNRTSEDESGLCAKCTKVATTFFVLVMAVKALGSVVMLYSVATAISFSTGSLRMAQDVIRFKTGPVARRALLAESAEIFCKERRADIRFSAGDELDAATSVSTTPSNRVKIWLLAGKRVKLHRISRHLE